MKEYKEIINSNDINKGFYLHNEEFPPAVIVGTTDICNLKCSCCGQSSMTRQRGIMDMSMFKKAIDEVAATRPETEVWMVFYGEPLILQYKIVYFIHYAKSKGLKNVFLNTNGLLMNSELAEALIDVGLDKIVFSLDAYYEETYVKMRNNKNFEKVKQNILDFYEISKRFNSDIQIQVQLIEIPNVHKQDEIKLFQEYWNEKGIETKIKPYVTWTGAVNIDDMRHESRYPCSWLFRTFVITWNGDVVQCGCDYDGKYIAGNFKEKTIKEIWQSNLKKIRDLHLENKYTETPICGGCQDWDSYVIMPFLTSENDK